jgi:hypothetical protein
VVRAVVDGTVVGREVTRVGTGVVAVAVAAAVVWVVAGAGP